MSSDFSSVSLWSISLQKKHRLLESVGTCSPPPATRHPTHRSPAVVQWSIHSRANLKMEESTLEKVQNSLWITFSNYSAQRDTAKIKEWKPLDIYLDDYSQLLKAPKITNEIKKREEERKRGRRNQLKDDHLFVQAGNNTHQVDFLEILNYKKFLVRIHWKPSSKPPMTRVVPEKKVAQLQEVIAQKDVRIGDFEKELAEVILMMQREGEQRRRNFKDPLKHTGQKLAKEHSKERIQHTKHVKPRKEKQLQEQ